MIDSEIVRARLIELCDTNNGWVDEVPVEKFVDYLMSNGVTIDLKNLEKSAN